MTTTKTMPSKRTSIAGCRLRPRLVGTLAVAAASFSWSCHFYLMLRLSSDVTTIHSEFPSVLRSTSLDTNISNDDNGIKRNSAPASSPKNHHGRGVHVVVSHCDQSIGWIWQKLAEGARRKEFSYDLKSVTVLSKCNVTIPTDDLPGATRKQPISETSTLPPLVQVLSLPNVGRCDHSYAYWIKEVLMGRTKVGGGTVGKELSEPSLHRLLFSSNRNDDNFHGANSIETNPFSKIADIIDRRDLVLFMKDNDNTYRGAKIDDSIGLVDVLDLLTQNQQPNETTSTAATTYSDLKASAFWRPISRGMACQSYPNSNHMKTRKLKKRHRMTNLAHRSVLWTFRLDTYSRTDRESVEAFRSSHRPMGAWIRHLAEGSEASSASPTNAAGVFSDEYYRRAIRTVVDTEHGFYYNATHREEGLSVAEDVFVRSKDYPTKTYGERDLVPLCFGGVFATVWGQVEAEDAPVTHKGWETIARALGREDNLEEGHYMERWWGDVLSWSRFADDNSRHHHHNDELKPLPATPQHQQQQPEQKSRGVTLSRAEQGALLRDKLRHMESVSPFAGMVVIDGELLVREGISLERQPPG